jgi:acetyltransferase EpsM
VGKGTQIGAAAVAIPGISIGQWCIVGAGSVLIRDLDDFLKAVGSPARPIARTEL